MDSTEIDNMSGSTTAPVTKHQFQATNLDYYLPRDPALPENRALLAGFFSAGMAPTKMASSIDLSNWQKKAQGRHTGLGQSVLTVGLNVVANR